MRPCAAHHSQKLIWVNTPKRMFHANMLPALTAAVFAGPAIVGHLPPVQLLRAENVSNRRRTVGVTVNDSAGRQHHQISSAVNQCALVNAKIRGFDASSN
jgi:hypothetical protein